MVNSSTDVEGNYTNGNFSFQLDLSSMLSGDVESLDLSSENFITGPLTVTVEDKKKSYPTVTKSADYSTGGDEITWTILISNPEALANKDSDGNYTALSIMDAMTIPDGKSEWYSLDTTYGTNGFMVETSTDKTITDSSSWTEVSGCNVVTDSNNFRLDLPSASYSTAASSSEGFYTRITYKTKVNYKDFSDGVADGGEVKNTASLVETPTGDDASSHITDLTPLKNGDTDITSYDSVQPKLSLSDAVTIGKVGVTSNWNNSDGDWYTYDSSSGKATLYWEVTVEVGGRDLTKAEIYDYFATTGLNGMKFGETKEIKVTSGDTTTDIVNESSKWETIGEDTSITSGSAYCVTGWRLKDVKANSKIIIHYTTTVNDFKSYSESASSSKGDLTNSVWAKAWVKMGEGPGTEVSIGIETGTNSYVVKSYMTKSFVSGSYNTQNHTLKWEIVVNPNATAVSDTLKVKEKINSTEQAWIGESDRGTYKITYKIDNGTETDFPSSGDGTSTMKLDETNASATTDPYVEFIIPSSVVSGHKVTIYFYTKVTDNTKYAGNTSFTTTNTAELYQGSTKASESTATGSGSNDGAMLKKAVATEYNYSTHNVTYEITANSNKTDMPADSVITDDLATYHMTLVESDTEKVYVNNAAIDKASSEADATSKANSGTASYTYIGGVLKVHLPKVDAGDVAQRIIKFTANVNEEYINSTANNPKLTVNNKATLSMDGYADVTAENEFTKDNKVVSKTGSTYTNDDGWGAKYEVLINQAKTTLKSSFTVTDSLPVNMKYIVSTIELYTNDVTSTGSVTTNTKLTKDTDYTYTITKDATTGKQTLTLTVKNATSDSYTLKYSAKLTVNPNTLTEAMVNNVSVSGFDKGDVNTSSKSFSQSDWGSIDESKLYVARVTKLDKNTNAALSGAKFGLYRNGTLIATATTGSTGVASFIGLDKDEEYTYTIKEIEAPTNYKLSGEELTVTLTGKGSANAYTGTIYDVAIGKASDIFISKVTVSGGKETGLKGATLALYKVVEGGENTLVERFETTEEQHTIAASKLALNTEYLLVEESAPSGYNKASNITFKIDSDGYMTDVTGAYRYDKDGCLIVMLDTVPSSSTPGDSGSDGSDGGSGSSDSSDGSTVPAVSPSPTPKIPVVDVNTYGLTPYTPVTSTDELPKGVTVTGNTDEGYPILRFTNVPDGWTLVSKDDDYDWVIGPYGSVLGVRKARRIATGDETPIAPLAISLGILIALFTGLSLIIRIRKKN